MSSEYGAGRRSSDASLAADELDQLSLEDATYHKNDLDLSSFGDLGERVNELALPPRETADA